MPTPIDQELRSQIAARLKHARARLRYTSSAMAREMNVTPQRWHNYESGVRPFDLPIMIKFCERFGITLAYLIRNIKAGEEMSPGTLAMLALREEPEPLYGRPGYGGKTGGMKSDGHGKPPRRSRKRKSVPPVDSLKKDERRDHRRG